jgi:hypothetical protein
MTRKPPPVPPSSRSPKGPGDAKLAPDVDTRKPKHDEHPEEQGEQGNIVQNTTNQGYQQDR